MHGDKFVIRLRLIRRMIMMGWCFPKNIFSPVGDMSCGQQELGAAGWTMLCVLGLFAAVVATIFSIYGLGLLMVHIGLSKVTAIFSVFMVGLIPSAVLVIHLMLAYGGYNRTNPGVPPCTRLCKGCIWGILPIWTLAGAVLAIGLSFGYMALAFRGAVLHQQVDVANVWSVFADGIIVCCFLTLATIAAIFVYLCITTTYHHFHQETLNNHQAAAAGEAVCQEVTAHRLLVVDGRNPAEDTREQRVELASIAICPASGAGNGKMTPPSAATHNGNTTPPPLSTTDNAKTIDV
jgi:hypothetical protein